MPNSGTKRLRVKLNRPLGRCSVVMELVEGVACCCDCGNELHVPMKGGEFDEF
jgi:hypothetical protein